jgi:hypothetical protein
MTNDQAPKKLDLSLGFGIWSLVIVWDLGTWSLGFPVFSGTCYHHTTHVQAASDLQISFQTSDCLGGTGGGYALHGHGTCGGQRHGWLAANV